MPHRLGLAVPAVLVAIVVVSSGGAARADEPHLTTWVGADLVEGSPALTAPMSEGGKIVVDRAGNIFFNDLLANRRIDGATGRMTTIAGSGLDGHGGDGGPAVLAGFREPNGIALDPAEEHLYIADFVDHRVRRVALATGIITTFAGDGYHSDHGIEGDGRFLGEGVPATEASLNGPLGVAVDAFGDVFIAELFNSRVRRVDRNGIITTIAGGAGNHPQSRNAGPLEAHFGERYPWNRARGNPYPGFSALIDGPWPLAFDAEGNLYVGEMFASQITRINAVPDPDDPQHRKRVGPHSSVETIGNLTGGWDFAGDGGPVRDAKFAFLNELKFDRQGNLFVSDAGNNRIRRIEAVDGRITQRSIITTVALDGTAVYSPTDVGGPASAASMWSFGMALGPTGDLFFTGAGRVFRVRAGADGLIRGRSEETVETVAGDHLFKDPLGLAHAGRTLYTASVENHRILQVSPEGAVSVLAGSGVPTRKHGGDRGDGCDLLAATFDGPYDVVASGGDVFVADQGNTAIRRIHDGCVTTIGDLDVPVFTLAATTVDEVTYVYASSYFVTGQVWRIAVHQDTGVVDRAELVAGDGELGHSIEGGIAVASPLLAPAGLAVTPDNRRLYIGESPGPYGDSFRVLEVDLETGLLRTYAGGDTSGVVDGAALDATLLRSRYLALGPAGELYVAHVWVEGGASVVRKIQDGVVTTVAGCPIPDNGDCTIVEGAPARGSQLSAAMSLTVADDGVLYILENGRQRIARLE